MRAVGTEKPFGGHCKRGLYGSSRIFWNVMSSNSCKGFCTPKTKVISPEPAFPVRCSYRRSGSDAGPLGSWGGAKSIRPRLQVGTVCGERPLRLMFDWKDASHQNICAVCSGPAGQVRCSDGRAQVASLHHHRYALPDRWSLQAEFQVR
jgi:hypothetical protein